MQLVIFDVDGTLTRSTHIDAVCFLRAVHEVFGMTAVGDDWSQYTHCTDSGISAEIFHKQFGRAPSDSELAGLRERFVALLEAAVVDTPDCCSEIPGARAVLRRLQRLTDWRVAIATGSWKASALVKLGAAGFAIAGIPMATADDGVARETILQCALTRALESYRETHFSRVVSVGDALWDVRSAARLQLPFIGVGGARAAELLREHGASVVLDDFVNFDHLCDVLRDAGIPDKA